MALRLTQTQVEMYARAAGLSPDRARIAGAIAMAESSGIPSQHNDNPATGDDSYGLWQINMRPEAGGADRRRKLGLRSDRDLYDPAVNARAMAMISNNGANFGPWSTYSKPPYAYKKYLATSGGAAGAVPAGLDWGDVGDFLFGTEKPSWDTDPFGLGLDLGPGTGALQEGGSLDISDVASGVKSIAELAVGAAAWLSDPHNWVRAAQVVGGLLLVGVGIAAMTRGAWEPAAKAVASVTPIGKAGGAAAAASKTTPKVKTA